jgi:hypothetical protein
VCEVGCVVRWQSEHANVWIEHSSGARFGFQVTDLARLAGLAVPEDVPMAQLSAALNEVLDDDSWIADLLRGVSPAHAPTVRIAWRSLALVEAAEIELRDQITPAVLDLDRALAFDRIGADQQAVAVATSRSHTAVEVVELLHDAGLVRAPIREDILRLLELAGQSPLLQDLRDTAQDRHRTDDAIENIFREVLTPAAPAAVLDASEREPVALPEQEMVSKWRTQRRIRATEQSLNGVDVHDDEEQVRILFDEQRKAAREQLGAQVLKLSLDERFDQPQPELEPSPLLAELIFCLLSRRKGLDGSLAEAVRLDMRSRESPSPTRT